MPVCLKKSPWGGQRNRSGSRHSIAASPIAKVHSGTLALTIASIPMSAPNTC